MNDNADGWKPGKFTIKHYRRGDLLDGEAFALVPARDPAAIVALRAYARATPDIALAAKLDQWVAETLADQGQATITEVTADTLVPSWVATLCAEVEGGRLSLRRALFRMAALTRSSP